MTAGQTVKNTWNVLIAGFGGQGILFSGKFLVYMGLIEGKQVSWLPSYGPEMRGGTANCSVIISDRPVGSPIVAKPDLFIVMNLPSLDRFENDCVPDAKAVVDSSLIGRPVRRADVEAFYIPATRLADENGLTGLANMIMAGKAIRETGLCDYMNVEAAMKKTVPERKIDLFDANIKAVEIGYRYES